MAKRWQNIKHRCMNNKKNGFICLLCCSYAKLVCLYLGFAIISSIRLEDYITIAYKSD